MGHSRESHAWHLLIRPKPCTRHTSTRSSAPRWRSTPQATSHTPWQHQHEDFQEDTNTPMSACMSNTILEALIAPSLAPTQSKTHRLCNVEWEPKQHPSIIEICRRCRPIVCLWALLCFLSWCSAKSRVRSLLVQAYSYEITRDDYLCNAGKKMKGQWGIWVHAISYLSIYSWWMTWWWHKILVNDPTQVMISCITHSTPPKTPCKLKARMGPTIS